MRSTPIAAALALALALAGCGAKAPIVASRFEPRTARPVPARSAENAALARRGDIDTLGRVGGDLIGTLRVEVRPDSTNEAVGAEVRKGTAALGGTHAVVASAGTYLVVRVPPERWAELPPELRPEPARPRMAVPYHWVQDFLPGRQPELEWQWVPVDE